MKLSLSHILSVTLLMAGCAKVPVEKPNQLGDIPISQISSEWPLTSILHVPGLQISLPEKTKMEDMGKGSTLVNYQFYNQDGTRTGTGFAMILAKDNADFPPGYVYDSACDAQSKYTVEFVKNVNGYTLEKIRTDCGKLVKFLIVKDHLLFRIHPADQSERVLSIAEQIVSTAKITPEP